MTFTFSLRVSVIVALLLASFSITGIARANTICYPDGCATLNFVATKAQWDAIYGEQTTLKALVDTALAYANATGDRLNEVVRDSAGNITFIDCGNSHLHTFVYNCNYQFTCRGSQLVDYCGNVSQTCNNGCANNACITACPAGYIMQNRQCVCPTNGYTLQDGKCIFSACPGGYVKHGDQCVLAQGCDKAPKCVGDNLVNSCTNATILICANGCQSGACYIVPSPSATIKAIPMLVHPGNTTVVSWAGANVRNCTVHGTNGDSWTGVQSSGETSSAIHGQTIYTLHCTAFPGVVPSTVDKSVTVDLIPTFNEK